MGRGLSDLQRRCLLLALDRAGDPPPFVDLLSSTAIRVIFDPPVVPRGWGEPKERNRAKASISRAFRRLEDRGLVCRMEAVHSNWAGVRLTRDGIAAALLLAGRDDDPLQLHEERTRSSAAEKARSDAALKIALRSL